MQKWKIILIEEFDNACRVRKITISELPETVKIATESFYNETIKLLENTQQDNVCISYLGIKRTKKMAESTTEILTN